MMNNIDGKSFQYADDSSIICLKRDETMLNDTLEINCMKLTSWIEKCKMKINCSKTDITWFKGSSKPVEVNTENITIAQETKVLELTLDN